ncbi:MAG TPA: acyl-CoA reductase, partial [Polyangiaceae bacterium]
GERIRVRGHGAGMGAALVGPGANLEEAARALADDVVAFDQRGCLSPRVALVEGEERAKAFAGTLHEALEALERKVPRGRLRDDERADASRYAATLEFAGEIFRGPTHLVGLVSLGAPLTVPPPGRHLHVAAVRSLDDAGALLAEIAPVLVALGTDDPERASRIAPAHARLSPLGRMQRPPLDGPVDRRPH